MSVESHPVFSFYRWGLNLLAFCFLILPALIALGVDMLTDFGQTLEPVFFEVLAAGVLPVFVVASILQYAVLFGRVISTDMSKQDLELLRYQHRRLTRLYGLIFVAGESIALYAVATGEQSTFLALATCFYALVLLYILLGEIEGLGKPPEAFLPTTAHTNMAVRESEVSPQ